MLIFASREGTLAFVNNPTAWVIILLVVVLLFGGKNIPEVMKGLGQSMREFKKGMQDDEEVTTSVSIISPARFQTEREQEIQRRIEAQRRSESEQMNKKEGSP